MRKKITEKTKHKMKLGFTLIEVTLFLAISGLLLVSVTAGTGTAIARRRFNDASNDVVEYLRSVYSSVLNTENVRHDDDDASEYCTLSSGRYSKNTNNYPGRTRCAIYGKLITFGEDFNGPEINGVQSIIHTYDIIGTVLEDSSKAAKGDTLNALMEVNADVVSVRQSSPSLFLLSPAGQVESYRPMWDGTIEDYHGNTFRGAVMIVRSPSSNAIDTYIYSTNDVNDEYQTGQGTFNIQKDTDANSGIRGNEASVINNNYRKYLYTPIFNMTQTSPAHRLSSATLNNKKDLYICFSSPDVEAVNNHRRTIKIKAGGKNTSAVEILAADSKESLDRCGSY